MEENERQMSEEEERKTLSRRRLTYLILGFSVVLLGLILAEIVMIFLH